MPAAEDEAARVLRPVAPGERVLCRIARLHAGFAAMHPGYELHVEGAENDAAVLCARRSVFSGAGTYCVCTGRDSSRVVARMRSNVLGTLFVATDRGGEAEFAAVTYEPNVFGMRGPRRMAVLLPGVDAESMETRPVSRTALRRRGELSVLHGVRQAKGTDDPERAEVARRMVAMANKAPQWNEDTHSFVLNFQNRVTRASVKNFQIVPARDPDYVALQFGRIGPDLFTLDVQYPLSLVQAFCVALSSFDSKIACE